MEAWGDTAVAIDAGCAIWRREGCLASEMRGETILFSLGSGKYYNLGVVGGRIWELLEAPRGALDLTDALTAEFDVERERCARQVDGFLRMLLREALIEVRPA
ncbi:lasso peptide biosynthesis PqqD family chaperone [Cohnella fermenti]|uniref:Lasso peptide biosynthesis PqqD family chaperone n=1 Tax=Cohnella fermenti TaxID=2565925 RepID=A0A4S4BGT4_9BACL|nr:lasso peptide biosynthesis PqqD family chaperone [Cohnella fermenti]THF73671.1 lasso peptide biosynthesis PqqD family chaperone [Cohnella fermenti]